MRIVYVAIILSLAGVQVSGQNENDSVKLIERTVRTIDADTNYWSSSFTKEDFLDSGFIHQPLQGYGTLTGIFKNGKICKIREQIGLKLTQDMAITEYYFLDGKVLYISEREWQGPEIFIDSAGTVDHRTDEPTFEAQYFFSDDKLIHSSETGDRSTVLLPDEKYFLSTSKEGQLLVSAKKYYRMFSVKYKQ